MNILLICSDTFRWDYLGAYGNDWIRTPNLDRLASEGIVFDELFGEGLPTLPMRRVLMTGRHIFPFELRLQPAEEVQCHGWHPIYDHDVTLSEHLREQGYISALFNDVYHVMKPGMNFHRGFHGWYWTRGQEDDPYRLPERSRVAELAERSERAGVKIFKEGWPLRHLVHRAGWQSDADTPCAQTVLAVLHAHRAVRSARAVGSAGPVGAPL
jgi:arylsulfatase A-like enzyme